MWCTCGGETKVAKWVNEFVGTYLDYGWWWGEGVFFFFYLPIRNAAADRWNLRNWMISLSVNYSFWLKHRQIAHNTYIIWYLYAADEDYILPPSQLFLDSSYTGCCCCCPGPLTHSHLSTALGLYSTRLATYLIIIINMHWFRYSYARLGQFTLRTRITYTYLYLSWGGKKAPLRTRTTIITPTI